MYEWILIVVFGSAQALTSETVEFHFEQECHQAGEQLVEDLRPLVGNLSSYSCLRRANY